MVDMKADKWVENSAGQKAVMWVVESGVSRDDEMVVLMALNLDGLLVETKVVYSAVDLVSRLV